MARVSVGVAPCDLFRPVYAMMTCQSLSALVTCDLSPQGDLLLSASPGDGAVVLWNVAEERHVPLSQLWWLGNTFCRWSPDARRVLGATTGHTIR